MNKLPKYTLSFNNEKARWDFKNDATNRVIKTYSTKTEATIGGTLENALGKQGGSVKIQLINGKFEEERTYPGNRDPKESKG